MKHLVKIGREQPEHGDLDVYMDEVIAERFIFIGELKAQITWEGLDFKYLTKEFTVNLIDGHENHSEVSNKLLVNYLHENLRAAKPHPELNDFHRVNIIWLDFYKPSVC
jgi:hypothetical protein